MRALRHNLLAPLAVAAAIFALGASAELAAAPAARTHAVVAGGPPCPAGTNWNNGECQ